MVYCAFFVGLLAASLLGLDRRRLFGLQILYFNLVSMVLLLGLRHGVGDDFFSYKHIFNEIEDWSNFNYFNYQLSESYQVESGYAILNIIIKIFSDSYSFFVFILAFISIFLKYKIFNKLSPFIGVSFLLYFSDEWFWKDLSGSRVAIASTLVLFCAYYAYKRNFYLYTLFLLLAMSFHLFSIIAFPVYFASFFSSPLLMAVVLAAATAVAAWGGLGLLLADMAIYIGFDNTYRVVQYLDSEYMNGIRLFGGTFMLHIFLSSIMIYFYRQLAHKWKFNTVLIPTYIYGTVLMFIFIDYGIISGRIRDTLCVPVFTIILPSFLLLFKKNWTLIIFFCIVAYCSTWFYMMIKARDPYQSIFQFI